MQPNDNRPPDLLSQLRSQIVPTKDALPPMSLLAGLRSGIVSTRNDPPPADPAEFSLGEEIYVEEGLDREAEPEASFFESRSVEMDPDAASRMRRRAWEEYARRVAGGDGERRRMRKARIGRPGLRAWLELLLILASLIGLNAFVFPGDPGFRGLEFNPFFIPVVLLAVRFGTLIGGAAGAGAGLWILLGTGRWDLEDGSLVLTGMLVLIGMLSGIASQHQGERLAHLRAYARRLEERLARSRRLLTVKQSVIGELQSRIEEQAVSVEAMYTMSRRMSSTEPTDMFQALLQILHADLHVTRASVYLRVDAEFVLAASLDRGVVPSPFDERLDGETGLPALALRLQRRISLFDPEAEAVPAEARRGVVACGPVWEGKRIEAIVVIQDLPLLELTPAALSRLDALLGWASEVRSRLARLTENADPDYFDRRIGVYRFPYLLETLGRELQRARRHGHPLRVLRVRIQSYSEIPPGSLNAARECVSRALFAYLREGDTIGASSQDDSFLVILPMCEAATAAAIGFRMLRAIEGVSNLLPLRLSFEFVDPESVERIPDAASPPLEAAA